MWKRSILSVAAILSLLLSGCSQAQFAEKTEASAEGYSAVIENTTLDNDKEDTFASWQEAYRQKVCEDPAISLRGKPDTQEAALTPWEIYLGIHDFDGNGIPELILGDGWSAAVFTFSDGKAQRLANLDYPEMEFCINGLHLRENGLLAVCSGAGGMYGACFAMPNGEAQLAHFVWYPPFHREIEINGVEGTWEELCGIYLLDTEDYQDWHERYGLQKEPGGWVLTVYNGETKIENGFIVRAGGDEIPLDAEFDFSQFNW